MGAPRARCRNCGEPFDRRAVNQSSCFAPDCRDARNRENMRASRAARAQLVEIPWRRAIERTASMAERVAEQQDVGEPALIIVIELEGHPELRVVAASWEAEQALRRWLELGYARRDIDDALDRLDELEEAA
jgi:hypothetical protein